MKANTDAQGNDYNGQAVNYNARTGDTIRMGDTFYFVRDSYPLGIRLERPTQYGMEVTEWFYPVLKDIGAIFSVGCA